MGYGLRAQIYSSSVVMEQIRGNRPVGGLVGYGLRAQIYSSSVVVNQVNAISGQAGGLVGNGESAHIHSSSVVVGVVASKGIQVGGLVAYGEDARIVSASVVAAEVRRTGFTGGLVGLIGSDSFIQIAYSYVVSGSHAAMLVGFGNGARVASYWDSETSGVPSGNFGTPQTTSELRSPTGYTDIYANWTDDTDVFGDGEDVPLAVWCDRDHSGNITADEQINDNLIWDFGSSSQYPAIKCTPISPTEWRDWWFLNASGKPELDRERLEEALNQ